MACAADLERSMASAADLERSMACAADLERSMASAADLERSMACAADLERSKASPDSFRPSTLPGTTAWSPSLPYSFRPSTLLGTTAWRPCLPYSFQPPTPHGTDSTTAPPGSFQSPTLPGTDATTTDRRSCLPAWLLLDKVGHIENCQNATKAQSWTRGGQEVIVSFLTAEPPDISHFSIHCPGLSRENFATQPCVVHLDDNLVLLSFSLKGAPQTEYCIYRAGPKPSLNFVQGLDSYTKATGLSIASIGFVTLGDGEHFVLAALKYTLTPGQYEIHVFRSKLGTWTCNVLLEAELNAHRMVLNPEKVISLGSGKIGWVDLLKGILVCNVVNENPVLSFIPLPSLLPVNQVEFRLCNARPFRDVVCLDGMIRCIERESCRRRIVREIPDVSSAEVLHDSELWWDRSVDTKEDYEYLGWRIITWNRPISSNCWHKGYLVHVDEILVNSPRHSVMLAGIGHNSPRNLKALVTSFPTLSMVNSEVVYLVCKGEVDDQKAWAVTINMRKKTAEELVPFCSEGSYFSGTNYIPCALSKYLNTNSDERLKVPGFKLMKPHTTDTERTHSLQVSGKQANIRKEKETPLGTLRPSSSTPANTRTEARINAGDTISRASDDESLKVPGFKLMKPHTADTERTHSLQVSGKQAIIRKEKETPLGTLRPSSSTLANTRTEARINAGGTISRASDGGTLIGEQNTSWGSSTTQTPQENVNNWTTAIWANHSAPNYGSYYSQVPSLYANGTYRWYGNYHHQLQPQPQPQLKPLQLQPPLSVIMR